MLGNNNQYDSMLEECSNSNAENLRRARKKKNTGIIVVRNESYIHSSRYFSGFLYERDYKNFTRVVFLTLDLYALNNGTSPKWFFCMFKSPS